METTTIDSVMQRRRSLERALSDLRAQRAKRPDPANLDRMIELLEAELAERRQKGNAATLAH